MQLTPTITFRGVERTAALETEVLTRLRKLDTYYGYIEAEDGHEVYFQRSSVLKDAFDRLAVGSAISFVEEHGEKGPQASTVKLLHPRRVHRPSDATADARVVR